MWICYVLFPLWVYAAPFITSWYFEENSTAYLLFINNVSVNVSWGDGQPNDISTGTVYQHDYAPGQYNISISGDVSGFYCGNYWCLGLKFILQWGDFTIIPGQVDIFANSNSLSAVLATDQPIVLQGASFDGMFEGCGQLNSNITLNTTGVVSMTGMFYNAQAFNGYVSFSDTSSVQNMAFMFYGAASFNNNNQPLSFSTKSVTTMQGMFSGVSNQFSLNFLSWNVSQVNNSKDFCVSCGLPNFNVNPCDSSPVLRSVQNYSVCNCPINETLPGDSMQCVDRACQRGFTPEPYAGQPGHCVCAYGFSGQPYFTPDYITGCSAIPCPSPAYQDSDTEGCQCVYGYKGHVRFTSTDVYGCEPIGSFRTLWKTTSNNEVVKLPIPTPCDLTVDWGYNSSSISYYATGGDCDLTFFYPTPNTYIITINGTVNGMSFVGQDCSQLYSILEWGAYTVSSTSQSAFANCVHLSLNATDQPIMEDNSTLTSFFANTSLTTQPINWDLTGVVNIDSMFANNLLFNAPVNFFSPNITSMNYLFQNCISLNALVTIDTSNVTSMNSVFVNASQFNQPLHFDTTNVMSFESFFAGARNFNSVLNFTNTSSVNSMYQMFYQAEKFNQPIDFDGSSLSTTASMFAGANSFNSAVNLRNKEGLKTTSRMFFGAIAYNQPTSLIVANGVDMSFMFAYATSFNSAVTFNNVTAQYQISMFDGATSFNQSINFPLATDDRSSMFRGATKFTQQIVAANFSVPCSSFCPYCILPLRTTDAYCDPCDGQVMVLNRNNYTMCNCPPGQAILNRTSANALQTCDMLPSSNITVPFSSSSNTTTVTTSGVRVVVQPDSVWGDNGTLSVAVKPRSNATVSQIVSINYYDSLNNQKNISGLSNPVQFFIPLLPGAATPFQACVGELPEAVVPACNWLDPVDMTWKISGCVTNLSATEVQCTCTHLTDFAAVLPKSNPIPINQALSLTAANIALHPDGIITIAIVLALFVFVMMMAVYQDKKEKKMEEELQAQKFEKWTKAAESHAQIEFKKRWWKQLKDGLQLRHTWGSLIFRKSGTTFRTVDRTVVSLFMLLVLMSMSASFHDRNQSFEGRAEVTVLNILVSLPPGLLLTHLFTHTGEMGFYEKWQTQQGMIQPSRFKCLRYRFDERWRYVWYAVVLVCVVGMIVYILSIALMFDQNPDYYCRGKTTLAWIVDFIIPYVINICAVEPVKIMFLLTSKSFLQDQRTKARLKEESAPENGESNSGMSSEMQAFPETLGESSTSRSN